MTKHSQPISHHNPSPNSITTTTPHPLTHLLLLIITVIALAIMVLILLLVLLRRPTYHPTITYDQSLSEAQLDFLAEQLADFTPSTNLTISALNLRSPNDLPVHTISSNEPAPNIISAYLPYDVKIPVADWDSTTFYISTADFDALRNAAHASNITSSATRLISIHNLTPSLRLLPVDSDYYLDTFTSGAEFQYLVLSSTNPDEIQALYDKLFAARPPLPNSATTLTLAQTGVTALSRGMYTKLNQVYDATYFAKNLTYYFSNFDYVHTSNEASFSYAASSHNICSDPRMLDALTAIHLNIVELTGNHNLDCGAQDAISTIDTYHSLGIQTFGGGKSATDAAKVLTLYDKNSTITLLGYNLSTGGYTLNGSPGANFYTEEKAAADITAAKERGDTVIVDIQYYECNEYVYTEENTICDAANSSAGDQIGLFRHLIDLGADIVVGTSAHQPQTFERYQDGYIYYGLGNLFFDQSWWPGTSRSLVLTHYFYNGQLLNTRIVPTHYNNNYQPSLMSTEPAAAFLCRLVASRPSNPITTNSDANNTQSATNTTSSSANAINSTTSTTSAHKTTLTLTTTNTP